MALEAAVTAATVLLVVFVLWPPGAVYWEGVTAVVGETPTLAVVVVLAAGAGAWFARTSGFGMVPIVLGIGVGYAVGMLAIQVGLAPRSPIHLLWYAALAGALVCGALGWWVAVRLFR